jgi:hypothetical protein
MSRKKISTTIYVTPEQSDKLKLLHERTKVPVAVYIREGIDLVLRHYGHLLPGQLPLEGGGTNGRSAPSYREGSATEPQATPRATPRGAPLHETPDAENSDRGSAGSVTSASHSGPAAHASAKK